MGKFNISTTGGQVDELTQRAHADLPVQEVVEEKAEPAPTSGNIEALLAGAPDVDAIGDAVQAGAEAEIAVQQQQERERVPDIISRRDDETRVDNYNYSDQRAKAAAASKGASDDGGLAQRSKNMGQILSQNNPEIAAIGGIGTSSNNILKDTLITAGAFTPEGTINKQFGNMMSVITEDAFAKLSFNEPIEGNITPEQKQEPGSKKPRPVSKIEGNKILGQQIHRDWSRYKNQQEGKPTDEYTDLPDDQATLLGDLAKEMYYRANKTYNGEQFLKRYSSPDGKQINFELTPHAVTQLSKGDYKRKRMFPKQQVRPSKIPLKGGKLLGEGRTYTKSVSGKAGKIEGLELLQESMRNLSQVPNVVDPQRLKILLATAIPVLAGDVTPDSPFATINHVGKDKMDAFIVKANEDPDYSPEENYENIVNQLAQDVFNVVKEKDGANYLSYYIQAFNGRIAPQQIGFDPTSSKTVRFVTRNAVPSKATPGSRVEKNLRQMYAMMLVSGADSLLPAGREQALERATPQLVRWGQELQNALNQIPDTQINQIIDGIKNGTPISQLPKLPVPQLSPELAQAIQKKGEDGQAFIDGVIDFTNYYEKKINNQPHFSYFNAYMDGKTNGLAANGMQVGSESVAYKTGVIRSQGKTLLDNDIDIRDDLKNQLLHGIDNDGFAGVEEKFNGEVAGIGRKVYSHRDLNKKTTMTFGYGMELDSMKKNIRETLDLLAESDPELKSSIQIATNGDPNVKTELVDALHKNYVEGLANALDPDALASRSLMRSAAILHAITNELFTIKSPIGLDLNFGAEVTTGSEVVAEGDYKLYDEGKRQTVKAYQPISEVTSAAAKRRTDEKGNIVETPGDVAYGGSVPGPVQSTDAATVALTTSGKSWNRLRAVSGGNPYIHTIYDAFKVDAMGYDAVLEETNKNWLDANMNWSYLEETRDAVKRLVDNWNGKMRGRGSWELTSPNETAVFSYLLEPKATKNQGVFATNLLNRMKKLIDTSEDGEAAFNATNRILGAMAKSKYNYKKPTQPTVQQYRTFVLAMSKELNLSNRLNAMIHKTNTKKKALKEKIKRDGHKVYQYYAH